MSAPVIDRAVSLTTEPSQVSGDVVERAAAAGSDVPAALALADRLGADAPLPGAGDTRGRWELLATLAAIDLTLARVVEPHLDALAILAESAVSASGPAVDASGTWGVFASGGPASTVHLDGRGRVTGTKPWCSLADRLDRALITVGTDDGDQLVAVDLHDPGVRVRPAEGWVAHGLPDVTSVPVEFTDVDASIVGTSGWYVDRPGFWWGGIGVAACWYGGALTVARTAHAAVRRRPTDIGAVQLARIDLAMHTARTCLNDAATLIDTAPPGAPEPSLLSARCRAIVAAAAETVLTEAGHLLGPAPLAFDAAHVQRVADLTLYVRQHHADRDLAGLGRAVAQDDVPPW